MPKKFPPMRIVNLQAENIKRLVAIDITPDSSLVQITGRNGSGKTSILDSIWWGVTGVRSIQAKPIREGANTAHIRLDMGELVVTRKFSRSKNKEKYTTSVTVQNADGAEFRSPQTMLDELIGELSFDPLEFARLKPIDQFNALRVFVPDFDFEKWQRDFDKNYEDRRGYNRRAKESRSAAEQIEARDDIEPIDEAELVAQLAKASDHNTDIANRQRNRDGLAEDEKAIRIKAAEILAAAEVNRVRAADLLDGADGIKEKLAKLQLLPNPIDTDELAAQLNAAGEHNAIVAEQVTRANHMEAAERLEKHAEAKDADMILMTEAKQAAVLAAKLPVPGLSFSDREILLDDLPFEQASDAEQLRTSVGIAMAANPALRVIRIRDGSLLDDDAMKMLAEMTEDKGYQVWIERVDSSGKVGFVIEAGELKK